MHASASATASHMPASCGDRGGPITTSGLTRFTSVTAATYARPDCKASLRLHQSATRHWCLTRFAALLLCFKSDSILSVHLASWSVGLFYLAPPLNESLFVAAEILLSPHDHLIMSRDAKLPSVAMQPNLPAEPPLQAEILHIDAPRMQYRSRPVSVAVDPVSLVISECISITSAIQKHARSPHSSVSAILGGNPNPINLGAPSSSPKPGRKSQAGGGTALDTQDLTINTRWGLLGQKGKSMQDDPMISGFGALRHDIAGIRDICTFDAPALLAPFLLVIQAKGTAAPITILALGALRKFLAYGFVCASSPRFALAMQSLSSAVTHCQFDVSDSAQGEVVLLMILNLMEDMMSGPGGDILSDESVCDMMGRGLAICSQPRFSPVLRRTAEAAMVRMCQIIFEDVKHLDVEITDNSDVFDQKDDNLHMDTHTSAITPEERDSTSTPIPEEIEKQPEVTEPEQDKQYTSATIVTKGDDESETSDDSESVDLKPYSLPSVRELFRVLVNFLDPNDRHHTDTMRVMALRIIHVAFEVAGPFIARHPALATIAEDKLCFYLFQLIRSDNMAILQESLIVAGTMLATCRGVLKLQQELFLSYLVACLHPSVPIPRDMGIEASLFAGIPETPKLVKPPSSQGGSGRATPVAIKDRQKLGLEGGSRKPDARQAMVESIGVLSRMPTFVAELFVNYDCDVDRADLCEDMIGLLSRNALPDSATWSTTSVPPLCLDALLRYIQFVAERLDKKPVTDGYTDPAVLREQRRRKKIIIKGTSLFNEKPKNGLGYLEAQGILRSAQDAAEVAAFLKETSRVSKSVLGEYLSKTGNEKVLKEFLDLFDFSGKRLDEGLRLLLESFRLPGEAQLIANIVESFSEKYCTCDTPEQIANKDAAYVLSYAIILLNTDQHNPTLKANKRMTVEDFSRNLRGVNDGKNFSPEYLSDIYQSIKSNEIILPDEHDNQHGFDYAWRELLLKTESAGNLVVCDTNIYDADMFAATWRPIVSTLSYVFMSASDDAVFARIVTGFDECARIAAKYNNVEALDQIVYCLSYMTTLASETTFNTALNTEVQVGETSVMVSELAVKLGRDFRAQLATLVLFRVVTGSEHIIQNGWKHIIRIWVNLFSNSLASQFGAADLPRFGLPDIPLQLPSQVIERGARSSDTGFFSAFTSYISSYAADDPPEPSDEELESTLCTVDCINSCKLENVFNTIAKLPIATTKLIVTGLLEQLPDDDSATIMSVKQDNMPNPPPSVHTAATGPPKYDPSVAYILEFSTLLATRDPESVEEMAEEVFRTVQGILRHASQWHAVTVSRAVFYALRILKDGFDHEIVNVPRLLHTISGLPQDVLARTSSTILNGLAACTEEPGPLRSEMMTSPDFWATLRVLATSRESAAQVFLILEKGTSGSPPAIMADNYMAAVALLDQFASSANPLASSEKRVEQERRRHDQPRKEAKVDSAAVERGCKAIESLYSMTSLVPQLIQQSQLESGEAWSAYWLPIFQSLMHQCGNPCREVRQLAFSSLHRSLLSADLTTSDPKEWTAIFSKVLFPLILRLLKPEVFSADREGMSKLRLQATSLLCNVFLHYLNLLAEWDGLLSLWTKIIEIMDRLMNSGQGDTLEEAVRENLKNVILFMESNGVLVPPTEDPARKEIWDETWKRVDRFLPDLRAEIAPAPEEPAPALEPTAVVDGAATRVSVGAPQQAKRETETAVDPEPSEASEASTEEEESAEKAQVEQAGKEEQEVD
ncbi:cytohesin-2 [Cordyceps militaris CM01]|uniref:Cytohesin-2 n=1 Tax=Cordyceps militaris (strain CM01) TaxID=983644 RepID=G3J3Q8_CORMM|nr:cytohesin-2 [Cordyceps militaris CM01]EGX95734.1 cytohesin-2 [Cordyceps militaris CM01]